MGTGTIVPPPSRRTTSEVGHEREPAGHKYYWNHFAYRVDLADRHYVFLTDRRAFVELSEELIASLDSRPSDGLVQDVDPETLDALLDAGVVMSDPPLAQFDAVMRATPRSTDRELLHIITSYTCNLTCSYCFMLADLEDPAKKLLPFEEAKQGIDLYFSEPHSPESVIHFYGGEPLLHPKLIEDCLTYIESTYSDQVLPKIITNGTLTGPRVEALMERWHFDLSVSMDGDREAHDVFRLDHQGRSSFDATVKGIRFFQEVVGNNPKILITVGEHNIARLPEVVEFVLSLRPKGIALNFPRELHGVGSGLDDHGADLAFWTEQYAKSIELCFDAGIPELYYADMLFTFLSGEPALRPCAACGNQLSIGPGAKIGPCQAFVAAGQFSQPVTFYRRDDPNGPFADWRNVTKASSLKCTQCPIAPVCGGDCSFDRYNRTGSLHEPLELHCDLRLKMATILAERVIDGKPVAFAQPFSLSRG